MQNFILHGFTPLENERRELANIAKYNTVYRYTNNVKATREYMNLLQEKLENDKNNRLFWANEWLTTASYIKSKKQLKKIKDYLFEKGEGFFRDVVGRHWGDEGAWKHLAERYANAFGTSMKEDVTGFADFLAAIRMTGEKRTRLCTKRALRVEPRNPKHGKKMIDAGKRRAYHDIFDAFAGDRLGKKHAVSQKRLANAAGISLTVMAGHLNNKRPTLPPSDTKVKGAKYYNRQYFMSSYRRMVKELLYNLTSDAQFTKLFREKDLHFGKDGLLVWK